MKRRNFYISALWLPVFIDIVIKILDKSVKLPDAVLPVMIFFSSSGLQYIVFLGLLHWWMYVKRVKNMGPLLWWLPLIFAPVSMFGTSLYILVRWGPVFGRFALSLICNNGATALVTGYVYVVAIHAIGFMLAKTGYLKK